MNLDAIRAALTDTWTATLAYAPRVVAALAIVLAGWLAARLLRRLATRLASTVRLDRALQVAGVQPRDADGFDAPALLAGIVGWTVLLVTFQLAAEALGLTALSSALAGLVGYLPHVLVAVVIVLVALAFGGFVAGAIRASLGDRAAVGARIARWSIVGFGAFAALSQLQIAEPIVNALFYATLATVGLTVVVAFGAGGVPVARQLTAGWVQRVQPAAAAPERRAA